MNRRTAVLVGILLLVACTASVTPKSTERRPLESGPLGRVYAKYVEAIGRGDLAAAEQFVTAGKLATLRGMSDAEALAAIDTISPKSDLEIFREDINGDEAMLVVRANVVNNVSTGRIDFAREDGTWKIYSESWDLGVDPKDETELLQTYARPGMTETQREAIRTLRERGYAMPSEDFLVMAATTGDLEAVKLFLAAGYSPDTVSRDRPAIVAAASSDHVDVVKVLIDAGADVNARDGNNMSALMHLAGKCDQVEIVRTLLAAGARRDFKSAGGASAEDFASGAQCSEIEKLLQVER